MATAEALGKTETINGKRYYIIDENRKYPSVTTILGSMSKDTSIEDWRNRIGHEEADRISKFAANRGTIMHQMNEYYLMSNESQPKDKLHETQLKIVDFVKENNFTDAEFDVGRKLFFNFYNTGFFSKIKDLVSIEDMLYSHVCGGYAGRVDVIYKNKFDELLILDFKTSKKPKRRDWIESYYKQISAYFIAYWEMTGIKPNGGEIWISNEADSFPQIFKVTVDDIKVYGKQFLTMVKEYHETYSI